MKNIIPQIKYNSAALLGGAIGAGGSLIGSTIGAISQYNTNQTNKEIAESNNKAMLQAMREQTRSEQLYNSASEQMKRLQMAGLNPMTMAGQGPTPVSSTGVPSLDSPVMQNPFGDFNLGLDNVGSALIQSANLDLQARSIDVHEFMAKVDMLNVIGVLAKDDKITSGDIRGLVDSVMGKDNPYSSGIQDLVKDNFVVTRLNNSIETSNLSLKEKQYLYGWLDEFKNAEYTMMLADIDNKQTDSNLNRSTIQYQRSQERVNDSLVSLNEEKRKEIEQAISNMKEQWKSLNFQGELDAKKLLRIAEISDNVVDKIVYETKLSKKDANSYVWRNAVMPFLQTLVQSGAYVGGKFID